MKLRHALWLCLVASLGCSQAERPVEPHAPEPAAPRASKRVTRAPGPTARTVEPHAAPGPETAVISLPPVAPTRASVDLPARAEPDAVEQPSQPDELPEELPPYLRLIRRIDPAREGLLVPELRGPRTVSLTTSNVRRFRISRHRLPMRASGSLVLRVDGQVFEWTARHPIVELVFHPSSGWTVADPGETRP